VIPFDQKIFSFSFYDMLAAEEKETMKRVQGGITHCRLRLRGNGRGREGMAAVDMSVELVLFSEMTYIPSIFGKW